MNDLFKSLTKVERTAVPVNIPESFLRCVATSFGSLTYETIFVLDIVTGKLCFLTNTSGLSHIILSQCKASDSFKTFMETVSGKDAEKYETIIGLIKQHYLKHSNSEPENLLYMTDLGSVFNHTVKSLVTYKFTPCLIDEGKELRFLLGSLSSSVGKYYGKLVAMNSATQQRQICSLENGLWQDYEIKPLTEVELAVFDLAAQGYSIEEISDRIHRAPDSVKSIRKRIFTKFGVANITEARVFATTHKLV